MYYYGPKTESQKIITESNDIEKLLNDTLNEEKPREELRLPKTLHPTSYRLRIYPILDENSERNFTFTGHVQIQINCTQSTDKIVLHWDDLNITDSDVRVYTTRSVEIDSESLIVNETINDSHNISRRDVTTTSGEEPTNITVSPEDISTDSTTTGEPEMETTSMPVVEPSTEKIVILKKQIELRIITIKRDVENMKLKIIMLNPLVAGMTYTVDIKYSGDILDNLVGLYKTNYKDMSKNDRWLATTHLQPIYARRVLPCFDEPNFKATFEISVARRTNMTVLSNMPLRETEPMNETLGWVWDHFPDNTPNVNLPSRLHHKRYEEYLL
ncbi:hypothetical protein JTB14_002172 [Gonioctena quinquepunctata]|nr:hypothetical protein JTB14_002172 [Gonioctena quinquepunctata]